MQFRGGLKSEGAIYSLALCIDDAPIVTNPLFASQITQNERNTH